MFRKLHGTSHFLRAGAFAFAGVLAAISSGCGGGGGSSSGDPGTPVAMSALAGTISGMPFTAKSAFATMSSSSAKLVSIYAKDGTCMNQPQTGDGDLSVLLTVDPWRTGTAYELNLDFSNLAGSHTVTFVTQSGGTPQNNVVSTGRVELTQAADTGGMATLRVRASGGQMGSIEGQVTVQVCN